MASCGGAKILAQQMNLPFIARLPINMAVHRQCDEGMPRAEDLMHTLARNR